MAVGSFHKRRILWSLFYAGFFLSLGLITADHYGIGWDNPAHYRAGKLNFQYALGLGNDLLHFSDVRFVSPLTDLLSYLSYLVFFQGTGILSEIVARHLHLIVFGSATVGLTVHVGWESSPSCGLLSGFLLGCYPVFVGFSHLAMKGILAAFFFLIGYYLIYRWFISVQSSYLYLYAVALGLGLASKFVVSMLVPLVILFLVANLVKGRISFNWQGVLHGTGLVGTFWVSAWLVWPFLWFNPFRILYVFHYYLTKFSWPGPVLFMGDRYIVSEGTLPFYYEVVMLVVKSPFLHLTGVALFLLACVGGYLIDRSWSIFDYWLLVGLVVPIAILTLVSGGDYDATRQMLFWYPLFCLAAGRGWSFAVRRRRFLGFGAIAILSGYLFIHLYGIHPNEVVFFNDIVGRENGAAGRFELDYYGNSYRQAANWMNENLKSGAVVHVPRQANLLSPFVNNGIRIRENQAPGIDGALVLRRYGRNPYGNREPTATLPSEDLPLLFFYDLADG